MSILLFSIFLFSTYGVLECNLNPDSVECIEFEEDVEKINGSGKINISNAYTLPSSDGSANQVLQTNGSGVLSFADSSGGGSGSLDGGTAASTYGGITAIDGGTAE